MACRFENKTKLNAFSSVKSHPNRITSLEKMYLDTASKNRKNINPRKCSLEGIDGVKCMTVLPALHPSPYAGILSQGAFHRLYHKKS